MENLLNTEQMRAADAQTIESAKISSLDLMEKAAGAFVSSFISEFSEKYNSIAIYCGTGNNGGDGLAIARMLHDKGFQALDIKVVRFTEKSSADFIANLKALSSYKIPVREIRDAADLTE